MQPALSLQTELELPCNCLFLCMVSLSAHEDRIQVEYPGCTTRPLEEDPVHHSSLETKLKLVKEVPQGIQLG